MPELPVIQAAEAFRAALISNDEAAIGRLVNAYTSLAKRLQDKLDLLLLEIEKTPLTRGQVVRLERYLSLLEQVSVELMGFQGVLLNEIDGVAQYGMTRGASEARKLISYTVAGGAEAASVFNALPKDAIETLLGFLAPDGKLYERIKMLAPTTADLVSQAILDGVGFGYGPRAIAREITNALGMGLTDALRMVRTTQIYAYREASRATYLANADVVDAWVWTSALIPGRTCMSCVNMHGSIHPLSEPLNDHHNGLCAAIPIVKGFDSPITEDGAAWFDKQSDGVQRSMMGNGKYTAWSDGKLTLTDFTGINNNDVFGLMRIERSLKDILER